MPSFLIADTTVSPQLFMTAWNATTGEVTATSASDTHAVNLGTADQRDAAIVLVNSCAANSGKFIGHVPSGHP